MWRVPKTANKTTNQQRTPVATRSEHQQATMSSYFDVQSHWPVVILIVLIYIWLLCSRDDENVPIKIAIKKAFITLNSLMFMVYSKDNKGIGPKYNPDPAAIINAKTVTKTIVFIRHGESDWNNVFNKGFGPSFFVRLIRSLIEEFLMIFHMDSKFLDSPLNQEGIDQALELRRYLEKEVNFEVKSGTIGRKDIFDVLRGDKDTSVIVSSSLRRAISTTTLALWPRIQKTKEKIMILSSLQEISRNIDTRALSDPKTVADLPCNRISGHCTPFNADQIFDATDNFGNKTRNFYGIKRLRAFNEWVFQRSESVIICGGHSLWFKNFFQTYLPFGTAHDAKSKKMTNSGAVSFVLHRAEIAEADGTPLYRIDPDSIQVLYGGFTTK